MARPWEHSVESPQLMHGPLGVTRGASPRAGGALPECQ
jgi:hypothetical protein